MTGVQHLVQCHCILPQFKRMAEPIFHKFVVFSVIDDNDEVIPKLVSCNNCGVVHKVHDLCRSEIAVGNDSMRAMMSREQISKSLHPNISGLLDSHECSLPVWEHVAFLIEQESWGSIVTISQETVAGLTQAKTLEMLAADRVRLKVETRVDEITGGKR